LPEVPKQVFLNPGDWWFGPYQAGVLTTILGSCVSIVLQHPRARVLGISHALLPQRSHQTGPEHGRFAEEIVRIFVQKLQSHGLKAADCRVQLYGGGLMFSSAGAGNCVAELIRVGDHNVRASLCALAAAGLSVDFQDTGGHFYRRLQVNLLDGAVSHEKYPIQSFALPARR